MLQKWLPSATTPWTLTLCLLQKGGIIVMWCTNTKVHGLRTPREEIAFTARPKIQSQSQIFRYGGSIFCLPHRPNFSDIFDLCLHWASVVRAQKHAYFFLNYYDRASTIGKCFWSTHNIVLKMVLEFFPLSSFFFKSFFLVILLFKMKLI